MGAGRGGRRAREHQGAPPFRLERRGDLPVDGELISLALGSSGELVVATSSADPASSSAARDEVPGGASFPRSHLDEPYDVVVRTVGSRERTWLVSELPVSFPTFQPLPGGRLLAVGARARWIGDAGAGEHNAFVLAADGSVVRSFCIGDGVSQVQVSPAGAIWVGYFDEGVYGNYGWGDGDGPPPLGAAGISCWSDEGERIWDYASPEAFGPIDDCYAMNVDGETVWACPYSDFPIIRIAPDRQVRGWANTAVGASALAVHGRRVALVGGYGGERDRVVVVDLDAATSTTHRLALPDGGDLPSDAAVRARGSEVHVVVDRRRYAADLRQLP